MKKHAFFTGLAAILALAVILLSSSYAMAQA